ncbi:MAG: hypothetical protein FVQ81_11510 [Candidatus Glassbacteria bacterium]|nr:hypothetical protein [Candidatus Glassbacteria bacterium]
MSLDLGRTARIMDGGGGGDSWRAGVETRLGELENTLKETSGNTRKDFRWTWGLLVLLLGAGATAYINLSDHLIEMLK